MRLNRKFLTAVGCAGVLAFAVTGCSKTPVQAETPVQTESAAQETTAEEVSTEATSAENINTEEVETEDAELEESMISVDTICVWGPVLSVDGSSITMDNQSGISAAGELILNLAEDTLVLDAVNGFPVEVSEIKEGEIIYANLDPAMTMSLPPQTNPEVVICQVPEDFKAPAFVQAAAMESDNHDGYILTASNGETYQVAADCQILPYLTRNIVKLQDVQEGSTILVWSDEKNQAEKLVLFE